MVSLRPSLGFLCLALIGIDGCHGMVSELYEEYLHFKLSVSPTEASYFGFHEYDSKPANGSVAFYQDMGRRCEEFHERVDHFLEHAEEYVCELDRLYLKLIKYETKVCIDGVKLEGYLYAPITFSIGIQSAGDFFGTDHLFEYTSKEALRNPLKRLQAIPQHIDDVIETLEMGIAKNKTYAKESLLGVEEQFQVLYVANIEDSDFYKPFKNLPVEFGAAEVTEIQEEAKVVLETQVIPAYKKLDDYIQTRYIKYVRPTIGMSSVPDGETFYQAALEFHTSLFPTSPQEVHDLGLREVATLRGEVEEILQSNNISNSISDLVALISSQPGQTFESAEDILTFINQIIDKSNGRLQDVFSESLTTPEALQVNVKPMPESLSGFAYFESGSKDGKRIGRYLVNVKDPANLPKYLLTTVTLHEANPGHNFQANFRRIHSLPDFLAHPISFHPSMGAFGFPSYTAHSEGWGLYSEYLGREMGMYEDYRDLLGYYSGNLLRAARLVVDTGIHALGWSNEQALEYLVENTMFPKAMLEGQLRQYITTPGQATAYKVAANVIHIMRKKFSDRDGAQFDLKRFHRSVLSCQVPMVYFEECLNLFMRDY